MDYLRNLASALALTVFALVIAGCGQRELSTEQIGQVKELQAEADALRKEIAAAEIEQAKYEGGLMKLLIASRVEISKTTLELIQQRIHAIEAGSPIKVVIAEVSPDPARAARIAEEIAKEEIKIAEAEKEAAKYSGGLLQVVALSTAATEQQTLSMLRQQMLAAKFGLALPKSIAGEMSPKKASLSGTVSGVSASTVEEPSPTQNVASQIITVNLLRKSASKSDYQDFELLDLQFAATGLDKKARAIKGVLNFADLFDDPKFHLTWSIDNPISPGEVRHENGGGFKYNQFNDAQQWVRTTDIANMKVNYTVQSILYEDGSRRDFD